MGVGSLLTPRAALTTQERGGQGGGCPGLRATCSPLNPSSEVKASHRPLGVRLPQCQFPDCSIPAARAPGPWWAGGHSAGRTGSEGDWGPCGGGGDPLGRRNTLRKGSLCGGGPHGADWGPAGRVLVTQAGETWAPSLLSPWLEMAAASPWASSQACAKPFIAQDFISKSNAGCAFAYLSSSYRCGSWTLPGCEAGWWRGLSWGSSGLDEGIWGCVLG